MKLNYIIRLLEVEYFIKIFCLGLVFFLFVFSLQFRFIPGEIGTRVIIGILGFVFIINDVVRSLGKGHLTVEKKMLSIISMLSIIFFMALCTNLFNGTCEKQFLTYPLSITIILAGAFFVIKMVRWVYGYVNFEIIAKYIIVIVVIQCIIAFLMFLNPSLKYFLLGLLVQSDSDVSIFDESEGFRLIGFGAQFFGAGIVNCFTLILVASIIKNKNHDFYSTGWLVFSFFVITFLGMMMSRTTMIGIPLALVILLYKSRFWKLIFSSRMVRVFRAFFLFFFLSVVLVVILPASFKKDMELAVEYGFELFVNYSKSGKFSSASTNRLGSMYNTYPNNFKTWIIGDGFYAHPNIIGAYYMFIDVGYLRLIFYFGLTGLVCFLYFQFCLVKRANYITGGRYMNFFVMIFVIMLILNFKGFTDMTPMLSLFTFISNEKLNYVNYQ